MFTSEACWMTATIVNSELKKIKSRSAKLSALKEQIRIRVLGLGWDDLATPWSKDGKILTPDELSLHLKMIIKEQKRRIIPAKSPAKSPARIS